MIYLAHAAWVGCMVGGWPGARDLGELGGSEWGRPTSSGSLRQDSADLRHISRRWGAVMHEWAV